jgi:hypothetical protein
LNDCGDDPKVQRGTARPCQTYIRSRQQKRLHRAAPRLLASLKRAESFISGFEDDELQEGIADLLACIRGAIAEAERS